MNQDQIARVHEKLAGRIICERCLATLETYDEKCSANLDDLCPGFVLIERAAGDPSGQYGGPLP